jgi:LSD1 subclass zinc finger protein
MLIKCEHCGAPLDVDPNAQVVKCQFCKATTRVQQPHGTPPVQQAPPAYGPPPVPAYGPPPGFLPAPQQIRIQPQPKSGCAIGVLAAVVGLIGVSVAVFAVIGAGVSSTVTGGASSLITPVWWDATSKTCFLDANGDGIYDVAGLTGKPGEGMTPTLVDGKSGEILWRGEPSIKGARSACAGDKWLVVSRPDFRIEFHDARKPEVPVKYLGRDKLEGISLGKGCVQIKTADGTVTGVSLPGGTATTCDAPKAGRLTDDSLGVVGLTTEGTEISVGPRTYGIKKRKSGTEMLTVEVTESGKTLWSKELDYASPTFNTAIAVGRGVVMVWAASPADPQKAILVGLDANTGAQKYQKPQSGQVTNSIYQFQFNGRYLIAMYWGKVYAYEPTTGEIVWTVG